jgi:hypothetical protein
MRSGLLAFLNIAEDLELAGLSWQPEIGDEISNKQHKELISVLVDPEGMSPCQLRSTYLWLPTVEQMILQFEARQAILFHAGLELSEASIAYKTVIQSPLGSIERKAETLRLAMGKALRDLLLGDEGNSYH